MDGDVLDQAGNSELGSLEARPVKMDGASEQRWLELSCKLGKQFMETLGMKKRDGGENENRRQEEELKVESAEDENSYQLNLIRYM